MQGLYIDPEGNGNFQRPKSKKAVKELVKAGHLDRVTIEATSLFGNEYSGPLFNAPPGTIYFVGPDPYSRRTYYGSIKVGKLSPAQVVVS